ncbi:hypothetical protein Rhow_008891 [Rhodococcus wratislaviensis]|uniref:Uncharacterized protein n=1 Tax=Rhodococcus wratislaviensis TaxID=44752 RepID=A0A402CLG0_RHOWR|nr:hypothetical protein Rhow_008891 [Rhodococcus wratislaviensis]
MGAAGRDSGVVGGIGGSGRLDSEAGNCRRQSDRKRKPDPIPTRCSAVDHPSPSVGAVLVPFPSTELGPTVSHVGPSVREVRGLLRSYRGLVLSGRIPRGPQDSYPVTPDLCGGFELRRWTHFICTGRGVSAKENICNISNCYPGVDRLIARLIPNYLQNIPHNQRRCAISPSRSFFPQPKSDRACFVLAFPDSFLSLPLDFPPTKRRVDKFRTSFLYPWYENPICPENE